MPTVEYSKNDLRPSSQNGIRDRRLIQKCYILPAFEQVSSCKLIWSALLLAEKVIVK